jgi:methionyl-tRNA formyltransferase
MGTPHFASGCLNILLDAGLNIVGAVTATDKPAGRGHQIQYSAVKQLALQKNIPVLQPEKLKSVEFIEELYNFKADLFIVVAFRMLPEEVWSMPPLGTINLHASLLPQYRGAAPINWAIINGEKETGITTFFIEKEIDTGKILLQEKMQIDENETAGSLHDRMMTQGGHLLVKTIHAVCSGSIIPTPQYTIADGKLKEAPKLFKEHGKINWRNTVENIHNQIRGLSPFPGTWSILNQGKESVMVKIHSGKPLLNKKLEVGTIDTDSKSYIYVGTSSGVYQIDELQFPGKRKMTTDELLRGINWNKSWHFE